MTVIVGLVHEGTVYMGADSAVTDLDSHSVLVRRDAKIVMINDMIIGVAGNPRLRQLLLYGLTLPTLPEHEDLLGFLVTDMVQALKHLLKNETLTDEKTVLEGSSLMIGVRGHLYCLYDDYQVTETTCGYNAIGSAEDVALGSLHTTHALGLHLSSYAALSPQHRLRLALEAAQEHNGAVRAPFFYLKTNHGVL